MAVFMINICKFNGCGKSFRKLGDLIQHIEEKHIDYDPRVVEQKELQQPACLPLSYVLRFYTEATQKETTVTPLKIISPSFSRTSSISTPTSRSPPDSDNEDQEELASDTDDSNDSWTTPEEFSSDFILRQGSKNASINVGEDKPFTCPVPGCKKKYKNVNGIKYHAKNGHKKDSGKVRKTFKCPCGKSYRSSSGLKAHSQSAHAGSEGLKTLPVRTVTSLAVLDPGFTLLAKGRQGSVVQLGILTPSLTPTNAPTPLTLTPLNHKPAVPGL
ncbi:hypothetical protein B566_EDAN007223 [Ephemera danica]|nr:hypothetical protein B566_EDAN007223 [Ephemera danica]